MSRIYGGMLFGLLLGVAAAIVVTQGGSARVVFVALVALFATGLGYAVLRMR